MFVKTLKTVTLGAVVALSITTLSAVSAHAADDNKATITLTINGVALGDAPLYISVQTRAAYMSDSYSDSALIASPSAKTLTQSLSVPAGDYAVTLWHDTDKDDVFTRSEDYRPLDGWGSSGTMPTTRPPVFDDVKVTVPESGKSISVDMIYPTK